MAWGMAVLQCFGNLEDKRFGCPGKEPCGGGSNRVAGDIFDGRERQAVGHTPMLGVPPDPRMTFLGADKHTAKITLSRQFGISRRPLHPGLFPAREGNDQGSGDESPGAPRCQGRQSATTEAARAGSVARWSAAIRQAWRTVAGSRPPK